MFKTPMDQLMGGISRLILQPDIGLGDITSDFRMRGVSRAYSPKAKRRRNGRYVTRTQENKRPNPNSMTYYINGDGLPIRARHIGRDPAEAALKHAIVCSKRVKRWFKNNDPAVDKIPAHTKAKAEYVCEMSDALDALGAAQ